MQSNDLLTEITTLKLQILDQERILDQAFSRNLELKVIKEKLTRLSELYEPNSSSV